MLSQQLIDISDRLTAWVCNPDSDAATLSTFVSKDVVVHVPTPGETPDFAGLLDHHKATVAGFKDLKADVITRSVDETNSMVTHFMEISGTHTGDWRGIPATGKLVKMFAIGMIKVDPETGLITDNWFISQEITVMVQLGVMPMPVAK